MPELPEVETIRRALAPRVTHRRIVALDVFESRLRFPVPDTLIREVPGTTIEALERRGKYLVFRLTGDRYLLVHLGMSGRLSLSSPEAPLRPHEHWQLQVTDAAIRMRDPRRFGLLLIGSGSPQDHPLLRMLGPEPLSDTLTDRYWLTTLRSRQAAIKTLIMDSHIVAGVGNIYANEALHRAGIHPNRPGVRLSPARLLHLKAMVRAVLLDALDSGGSTLRDYRSVDGTPGEFSTVFRVYGREGEPCLSCGRPIRRTRTGQRSTFYCPHCQR